MRKRPTKAQRKEALAVARAELALLIENLHEYPDAMRWNIVKTRNAIEHMRDYGTLPWLSVRKYEQFMKDPVAYSLPSLSSLLDKS